MSQNHESTEGYDTYLLGEWVLVDRRIVGSSLVPVDNLPDWMRMWSGDVVLGVDATVYFPAGTPLPEVVKAIEWHINADNVRGDA